jgi:putative membrane protein
MAKRIGRATLTGAIGGLVGAWAMSEFQGWWDSAQHKREPHSSAGRHDARGWKEKNEGRNANEIVGERVATMVLRRPPTAAERGVAAAIAHYTFGAAAGATYGALAERWGGPAPLSGATLGTVMWIGADNVAMPLFGLAHSDINYPMEAHLQSLVSHLVYGLTTESIHRLLRKAYNGG